VVLAAVHWWHWTAAQWATVVSAVATSLAALAAWLAASVSLALQRNGRTRQVSGAGLQTD
jgi:hypothetical protein